MLMERLQQHVTPHTSINVSLDDFPYYLEYGLLLSAYQQAIARSGGQGLVWAKAY
jgi:hypothetical protein